MEKQNMGGDQIGKPEHNEQDDDNEKSHSHGVIPVLINIDAELHFMSSFRPRDFARLLKGSNYALRSRRPRKSLCSLSPLYMPPPSRCPQMNDQWVWTIFHPSAVFAKTSVEFQGVRDFIVPSGFKVVEKNR
jgi:hypothetical protein